MSEEPQDTTERLAEMMAWHGMARYADPDVLAAYVRPARAEAGSEPADGQGVSTTLIEPS